MPTELIEGFEAHRNANSFRKPTNWRAPTNRFGQASLAGLGKVSKGYEHALKRCRGGRGREHET